MAIKKAAKEAIRHSARRKIRNRARKAQIRNFLKEVRSLIAQKKLEEAKALLPKIYKSLDKAAKTNVIKKNTASRKKSRISRLISKSR